MPDLMGLREEIGNGDIRALYLGWLSAADYGELEDDELEPPVPAGLATLSPSQEAFVRFIRVAPDLVTVGSLLSGDITSRRVGGSDGYAAWVQQLPGAEKDGLLVRAMTGDEPDLGARLRRRFGSERKPAVVQPDTTGRTVGTLIAATRAVTEAREQVEAEKRAKAEAKRLVEVAAAREKYLNGLARRGDGVWSEIEGMVDSKKPTEYDRAVRLIGDFRDVAERDGDIERYWRHLGALRGRHAKKVSFLGKLDEAGLEG